MSTDQQSKPKPMARDQWLEIIERAGIQQEDAPMRRLTQRYHVDKPVAVTIRPLIGSKKGPEVLTCSAIEVSSDGVMLRAHREVRHGAHMTLEWCEGDETFLLSGSVKHCTSTVGAFKVGIELEFPANQT